MHFFHLNASNSPFISLDLQLPVVLMIHNDPEICIINTMSSLLSIRKVCILFFWVPFVHSFPLARECKRERKAEKNARVEDSIGQELPRNSSWGVDNPLWKDIWLSSSNPKFKAVAGDMYNIYDLWLYIYNYIYTLHIQFSILRTWMHCADTQICGWYILVRACIETCSSDNSSLFNMLCLKEELMNLWIQCCPYG